MDNNAFRLPIDAIRQEIREVPWDVIGIGGLCYDEQTEILTRSGWKFFRDVVVGEEVATLNLKSDQIEYEAVDKVHKYPYAGTLYVWSNKHADFHVTPNHKMLVRSMRCPSQKYPKIKHYPWKLVDAQQFACYGGERHEFKLTSNWIGEEQEWFEFPLVQCADWASGHASHGIQHMTVFRTRLKMDSWLNWLGWYISEGHVTFETGHYKLGITQSTGSSYCEEVKQTMKDVCQQLMIPFFNATHTFGKYDDVVTFTIGSCKQLYTYLEHNVGKSAKDKHVPAFIKELSPRQITIFLNSLFKGDGSIVNGRWRQYYSKFQTLVDDVQELLLKVGLTGTVYKHRDQWVCSVNWFQHTPLVGKAQTQPYTGFVYCVTVPNHVIMVRRHGRAGWCGNSTQYKFIKEYLPVIREEHKSALIVGGGGFLTTQPFDMMRWLPELDVGCFTPETEIMCNPTTKPIGEIEIGTKILGLDGAYHSVTNTFTRPYSGIIYKIKPEGSEEVSVTAEHPFLAIHPEPCRFPNSGRNRPQPCVETCSKVKKRQGRRYVDCASKHWRFPYTPRWIRVDKLEKGDFLLYPFSTIVRNPKRVYVEHLLKRDRLFHETTTAQTLKAQGMSERAIARKLGTSRGRIQKHLRRIPQKTTPFFEITPDLLLLIGYYVSEGSLRINGAEFSFHRNEIIYIQDVLRISKQLGFSAEKRDAGLNGTKVIVCSKALAQLLRLFGKRAENKHIPHFALYLPIELQKSLLKGIFRGDGSVTKSGIRYNTVSKILAFQLRQLLLRQGIVSCFTKPRHSYRYSIQGKTGWTQTRYDLSVNGKWIQRLSSVLDISYPYKRKKNFAHGFIKDNFAYIPIRTIARGFYNGIVCNLEEPETKSYILASTVCAHNCIGEAYRTWPELLENVTSRDWKRVKGLVYREGSKVRLTPLRPLIPEEQLDDEVPFPSYDHGAVDPHSGIMTYLLASQIPYSPDTIHPNCRRLDVLSSYGCPWRCIFCSHNGHTPYCQEKIYGKKVEGKAFRHHSVDYVVNLITQLRLDYGINFVSFIDENMTVDRKWFFDFCNKFEEVGHVKRIKWGMVCHSKTVDAELLQRAKQCGCFLPGTLIAKNASVARIEDLVQAFDGERILTGDGNYEYLKATSQREYDGEIIEILPQENDRALTARVTPEHPILIVRPNQFINMIDRAKGNMRHYLQQYAFDNADKRHWEWLPANLLRPDDLLVYPVLQGTLGIDEIKIPRMKGCYNVVSERFQLGSSFLRLIGLYIAEGYSNTHSVTWCFGMHETELIQNTLDDLKSVFDPKNIRYRSHGNAIEISLGAKQIALWFGQFGHSAQQKHLGWLVHLCPEKQLHILKGFWQGDGARVKNGYDFTSISVDVIEAVKQMLLRNGIVPCIYQKRQTSPVICGRNVNTQDAWCIRVNGYEAKKLAELFGHSMEKRKQWKRMVGHRKTFILIPIRRLLSSKYNGPVYNLEVKKGLPSYTTLGFITAHNCSYISYGGESSSAKLLQKMGKGQTKEQMNAAIDATQAAGITAIMSFIVGFKETTIEDLIEDCQFFIDRQVYLDPFFLQPYPGSQLYNENKDQIIEQWLTDEEKAFLEHPGIETFEVVANRASVVPGTVTVGMPASKSELMKSFPVLKERIHDAALERWILNLDDATKMSVNLTEFNDIELAGLRYMLSKWEITRLQRFKKELAERAGI